MTEEAINKITGDLAAAKKTSQHARVMAVPVAEALSDFCHQDEEFARAVVQGGSFIDCMRAVAKDCGSALSDVEAYQRAVRFYFPGAKVRVSMSIDLAGDAAEPGVLLDLTSFL